MIFTDIHFLTPRLLREWTERTHPLLREIVLWLVTEIWPAGDHTPDPPLVITNLWRSVGENKRIGGHPHSPHLADRAIDLRNRDLNDRQRVEIPQRVNAKWEYDPERPEMRVMLSDDAWADGPHFHIQVHPNTRRRS